ncbi:MAG: MarR family transcriptional regulator [Cellulomonas sp. 14-74-6]|nr:MAG: MarR family transcriptional regulator [Cellulomonas sp. 14-74-6]
MDRDEHDEGSATVATGAGTTEQGTRWLSAEQQRHWRAFRDGVALLLETLGRELDEQCGLSLHEYEVMVRLSEAPGRTLRMSELASGIGHSRSRLTHTIARMEQAGLVGRRACRSDLRGVECTLTDAGFQRLVDAAPGHVASVRAHLVDVLTDEQLAAVGDAMAVVETRLREASDH